MKRNFLLILFLLIGIGYAYGISADLGEVGVGARPLSMGRAYVGYAADASSVFLNPAGIKESKEFSLVSMTGKLLEDVNYISVGVSNPFPIGTLGFGYINAGTSGIPLTSLSQTSTEVTINQYGVTDYSASLLYFSFARNLIDEDLLFGGSLKIFSQGFSQNTGSLEGATGSGLDADLGIKWKAVKGLSLGVSLLNIMPTSLGGKFVWKKGYEESIPSVIKIGSSFNIWGEDALYRFGDQRLLWNTDLEMNSINTRPGLWHTGLEWWINPILALRGGIDQKTRATATGIGTDNNLTGGVGIKYRGFSFDYAYHQYGELSENIAHFFSIGFLGEREPKKIKEILKEKIEHFKTELKKIEGLKQFSDVPQEYWAKDPIEYLATLGIMTGYPDDTFKPEQSLTRAELAALLIKAKGFTVSAPQFVLFPDLPNEHWAAPYIDMAMKRKYISGYPDGKFRPWKEVTKAEAIVVILKFAGISEPITADSNPFPDVKKSHWAARSITAAKQAGLLEYLSGNNFEPEKPFSRAEAAEVISKTDFAKEKIKELLKK